MSPHAEVIGAGISGLTTATALAQRGWSVRLHEREPEIRATGAGIYLWDNGLEALANIGVDASVTRQAHVAPAAEIRSGTGRSLYRIPTNGQNQARCVTVLRDGLISALLSAARTAGVDVVTGSTCLSARPDGTIELADGSTAYGDLIVAADGVHSRLRDHLRLVDRRIRMREGAARMMIPTSLCGPDWATGGYHLEHLSGRRRVLVTPCTPDDIYVALVCAAGNIGLTGGRFDHRSWIRDFPALDSLLRAAPETVIPWDNFEFISLTTWSRGRVAVLGDAAHAQPPYLGQGGGTAMMNAISLANAVTDAASFSSGLARWESIQRPDIERTQLMSYRMRLLDRIPDWPRMAMLTLGGRTPPLRRAQLSATRLRPAAA